MTRVLAIANQKGGVGKTTTAISLAGCALRDGNRVLLVDLDPQASLTQYLGFERASADAGAHGVLRRILPLAEAAGATALAGLDLVPAGSSLATLERDEGRTRGMGLRLAAACADLPATYDYVLLDSPPALGMLMINALAAADHLVVPTQTDPLARNGVAGIAQTVSMVARTRTRPLDYTVLATFYDRRTRASAEGFQALAADHAAALAPAPIPMDTQFREASREGLPVSHHRPGSRGARAYAAFWERLAAKLVGNVEAA